VTHTITINGRPVPVPDGSDAFDVPDSMQAQTVALKAAIEAGSSGRQSAATQVTIGPIPGGQHPLTELHTGPEISFTGFTTRPIVVVSFAGYATGQYCFNLHTVETWAGGVLKVKPAVYCHTPYSSNGQITGFRVSIHAHTAGAGTTFAASDSIYDEAGGALITPTFSGPAALTINP
jgi:hypothetical protein